MSVRRRRAVAPVHEPWSSTAGNDGTSGRTRKITLGAAAGLSATNIARLTNEWETEYRAFQQRSLADRDYVYVWVQSEAGAHAR